LTATLLFVQNRRPVRPHYPDGLSARCVSIRSRGVFIDPAADNVLCLRCHTTGANATAKIL